MDLTVALAIPLLLISSNVLNLVKKAEQVFIAYALTIVAVLIAATLAYTIFKGKIPEVWQIAGVIIGGYIGSAPNMGAVSVGLEMAEPTFIIVSTSEMLVGGIYLIFLTSVAKTLFSKFLAPYQSNIGSTNESNEGIDAIKEWESISTTRWYEYLMSLFFSILLFGSCIGLSFLVFKEIQPTFLIITLSVLGIALSLTKISQKAKGSFDLGQYLLLIFCIAIGMLSDFVQLMNSSPLILLFIGMVLVLFVMIQVLLSRIFKIDVDTAIIASTAAVFGPAFIGQVAMTLKNKEIIISGIVLSLIGYAIGNFIGIGYAYLLQNFF